MQDIKEIGKQYGLLRVIRFTDRPVSASYNSWPENRWVECKCSCGKTIKVPLYGLRYGFIKSCGHLRRESACKTLDKYRNSRHNETMITYKEKTMNISDWSKETGIPRTTIMYRLNKDLPVERVLGFENE